MSVRHLGILIICFAIASCGVEDPAESGKTAEEIRIANERDIANWEALNPQDDVQVTPSGLHYVIKEIGNGVRPKLTDTLTLDFDLFLGDGTAYTSTGTAGAPLNIVMDQLVPGLQEGLQLLSVGGSGVFLIPGPLGFMQFPPGIEDDDLLIYFVILRDINFQFEGEEERNAIAQYLEDNSLVPDTITGSGLNIIHVEEGNGEFPTIENTVTVSYHGTLLNGVIFDSSRDRGVDATFALTSVIEGWQEGIPYISKGGKSILIVPSAIAYGNNSPSALIPANSVLVFEVELKDFE